MPAFVDKYQMLVSREKERVGQRAGDTKTESTSLRDEEAFASQRHTWSSLQVRFGGDALETSLSDRRFSASPKIRSAAFTI